MNKVLVMGTFDTKAAEYRYLCRTLKILDLEPVVVDISCRYNRLEEAVDYSCRDIAGKAGYTFEKVQEKDRRGAAEIMITGARQVVKELNGQIMGIIAMGGANGSHLACEVMRILPLGFPKVMISVVAAGDIRENVGNEDIIVFNTVVDTYLNSIIKEVIDNACTSLAGMINYRRKLEGSPGISRKEACISMLGLVQQSLDNIREELEERGWELQVFHANGMGGRGLEKLVAEGEKGGVIELAINELINNLTGGVFDAGSHRMEAALKKGLPMVIVPGCIDLVNFWGQNIPERYKERVFIYHNVQNTLMRTDVAENKLLGEELAGKLNRARNRVAVLLPCKGFSGNDWAGGPSGVRGGEEVPWHDREANQAFIDTLKRDVSNQQVEILEFDRHINEEAFSREVLEKFLEITGVHLN